MPESILGITCPFCGARLKMETYKIRPQRGFSPSLLIYCDADNCDTNPCTIDSSPSVAFADVAAWKSGEVPAHE
jgi:hypothetical protein